MAELVPLVLFLVSDSHGLVTFSDLPWVYTGGLSYFALPDSNSETTG